MNIRICSSTDLPPEFYNKTQTNESKTPHIVKGILENVRSTGDKAIREYAAQFDKANPELFEISYSQIQAAAAKLKTEQPQLFEALTFSFDLALRFAQKQKQCFTDFETELLPGMITGQRTIAVERAGVYVPAGRFPLLSSVIMGIAPARAAGVKEIILCTPPRPHPDGKSAWADEGILATAALCGVSCVFACGGAQAIAAMAYGTAQIPQVDVIVGPGNAYVAEAKRQVYGTVGIDMLAGPTEVMILADSSANPAWVAADMLAQAEHDVDAQAVLVTTDVKLAEQVVVELKKQISKLPSSEAAQKSLENHGFCVICKTMDEAAEIANKKAPEHLELSLEAGAERDRLETLVRNYGSLFIGHNSAEVFGDYAAGLNHTLPTSGSARFTGGLSVRHFLKTVTTLRSAEKTKAGETAEGIKKSAWAADLLGRAEGLEAHAAAARIRLN